MIGLVARRPQKVAWCASGNFPKDLEKSRFIFKTALESNSVKGEVAVFGTGNFFLNLFDSVVVDEMLKIVAGMMVDDLREVFGICSQAVGNGAKAEIGIEKQFFFFHQEPQPGIQADFIYAFQAAGTVFHIQLQ